MDINLPDEPKIPFENYLMKLINRNDRKEASLYIGNAECIIQGIWNETVRKNIRSMVIRRLISKRIRVHPNSIYGWKNGKKAVSIDTLFKLLGIWKDLCNIENKEFFEKWKEIFESNLIFTTHSKHQKTKLPKHIAPKLSYLIGWICGDGHFKESNNYLIKVSEKSEIQLKLILKPIFKDLFNVDVPIFRRYMGGYAIQVGSKAIYRFFTQVLKVKVGEIPDIVTIMDSINKKYFLTGIFDSEGCVHKERPRLSIAQSNKEFLLKVKALFKEFDINCNGPTFHKTKIGEWYTIRIGGKKEFLKYYNLIGSLHVDKIERFRDMVIRIENRCG